MTITVRALCRVSRDATVDVEVDAPSADEVDSDEVLEAVLASGELLEYDDVELEEWGVVE